MPRKRTAEAASLPLNLNTRSAKQQRLEEELKKTQQQLAKARNCAEELAEQGDVLEAKLKAAESCMNELARRNDSLVAFINANTISKIVQMQQLQQAGNKVIEENKALSQKVREQEQQLVDAKVQGKEVVAIAKMLLDAEAAKNAKLSAEIERLKSLLPPSDPEFAHLLAATSPASEASASPYGLFSEGRQPTPVLAPAADSADQLARMDLG